MPYTVSSTHDDRLERVYCETAAKALARIRRCADDGHTEVQAISVEGIDVPIERLSAIARGETRPAKTPISFG